MVYTESKQDYTKRMTEFKEKRKKEFYETKLTLKELCSTVLDLSKIKVYQHYPMECQVQNLHTDWTKSYQYYYKQYSCDERQVQRLKKLWIEMEQTPIRDILILWKAADTLIYGCDFNTDGIDNPLGGQGSY